MSLRSETIQLTRSARSRTAIANVEFLRAIGMSGGRGSSVLAVRSLFCISAFANAANLVQLGSFVQS